ncbi:MAG: UDP-N-acetylmuramate dehydrogenase [Alphaproteobacteria bacterium]|nr:UDP-N-acetylmuramate dehydrogenase [Alphaproteobacteria bacterium]
MRAKTKTRIIDLPPVRGRMTEDAPLGAVGWFRTGGTADVLFKPVDERDLAQFLKACPEDIPVTTVGVMSNTIVRDGGVRGIVVRLGREFNFIEPLDDITFKVGAAVLDAGVANAAADAGITGMEFLVGIPGTIGGALKMNAGSYGQDMKSVLVEAQAVTKGGEIVAYTSESLQMAYRYTNLSEGTILTHCVLRGAKGDPETIRSRLAEIKAQRESTQPIHERTGGSTFANPEGYKAWQLIDEAGCRGLTVGGAKMSEMHCNFMINTGTACAADLEDLGEEVRRRVQARSGVELRWEIRRIGERS